MTSISDQMIDLINKHMNDYKHYKKKELIDLLENILKLRSESEDIQRRLYINLKIKENKEYNLEKANSLYNKLIKKE